MVRSGSSKPEKHHFILKHTPGINMWSAHKYSLSEGVPHTSPLGTQGDYKTIRMYLQSQHENRNNAAYDKEP